MLMSLVMAVVVSFFGQAPEANKMKDLDALLDKLHKYGVEHKMLNVPPEHGRFLWTMAQTSGAKRVLEIGTSDGYSTLWLARGVRTNGGKIVTLEIDKERHEQALANFKKAGFDDMIDARLGDAMKLIPTLEGEFDFIFIDAWKPDYIKYYEMTAPKLRPGGLMLAHNAIKSAKEMSDFLDAVKKDPNLVTSIVQIGDDGFSVSMRKKE
jgi:caffeoyl-CoA O-methyltransferase